MVQECGGRYVNLGQDTETLPNRPIPKTIKIELKENEEHKENEEDQVEEGKREGQT